MRAVVRLAEPADGTGVQAIYAPIVRDTAISFEVDPPSAEEMARRISTTLERWPWLVCADGGTVLGYVYAAQHRERAAYRWSVDVTVAALTRRQSQVMFWSSAKVLCLIWRT